MSTVAGKSNKIEIDHVNFTYKVRTGKLEALKDVTLKIGQGEFVCIIGPSGCGKSTLLHLIAGLLTPTSGTIRIRGQKVNGPGKDRAMVFQDDAVFPWLTVQGNVEYGLRLRGLAREEISRVVQEHLQMVGLQGMAHLYPRELSGGMRKRVDMARAFANDPDVLLMDEPFGMLDAMTKANLQMEVLNIWEKTKKTVCFVTHDLEEALFLGDRVVVMQARPGKVQQEVEVPFSRPRSLRLKTDPQFQELRRQLFDTLAELSKDM